MLRTVATQPSHYSASDTGVQRCPHQHAAAGSPVQCSAILSIVAAERASREADCVGVGSVISSEPDSPPRWSCAHACTAARLRIESLLIALGNRQAELAHQNGMVEPEQIYVC